jgi:hypothetical protein
LLPISSSNSACSCFIFSIGSSSFLFRFSGAPWHVFLEMLQLRALLPMSHWLANCFSIPSIGHYFEGSSSYFLSYKEFCLLILPKSFYYY